MKAYSYSAAAAIALLYACLSAPAEAARCPQGYIYRPSQGVCQHKAKSIRYTRRAEARRAKAEAGRDARRARIAAKAKRPQIETSAYPPPRPPWEQDVSPAWYAADPTQIAASPFGALAPMPESVVSWALRNGETR